MNLHIKNILLHIFVTLMLFVVPITKIKAQQAPGGTNYSVELWFAADKLSSSYSPSHDDDIAEWQDLSSNKVNAIQTNSTFQPKFYSEGNIMNFQPSVSFTVDNQRLISSATRIVVNTKSYYMFIVSQMGSPNTSHRSAFNLGGGYNMIGWYDGLPYFSVNGTATANRNTFIGPDRNYGITGGIIPNNGTGTPKRVYFNGVSSDNSTSVNMAATATGNFVIGSYNDGTTYPFFGNVQEIIVLSTDTKGMISDDAASKINTYLAIKYGITLKNQTYKGSTENVWTPATGYNTYVFGIGRDDITGLYQKQSVSHDDKQQAFTVFTGDLSDLNMYNAGEIADKGYLMFGSNGKNGADIAYTHPSASAITHRSNTVLKAQKTSAFNSTVGFKVNHPRATHIMVSSSDSFNPATTQVYEIGEDGTAKNITINDGDFVCYAISRDNTSSVSPGGVGANLETELWLAADKVRDVLPQDGRALDYWNDLSPYSRTPIQTATDAQPTFNSSKNIMNFQPAINFSVNAHRMVSETAITNFADRSYYVFYVSNIYNQTGIKSVFSYNTNDQNIHGWNTVNPVMSTEGVASANLSTYTQDAPVKNYGIIGSIRPNNGSTNGEIYFNGNNKDVGSMVRMTERTGQFVIGSNNDGDANPYIGDIQEVIVYSTSNQGRIDETDATKINTYLALKYGITLTKGDYTGTPGIVWSRSGNTGYETNIFGIGRDSKSALNQKQAQSFGENGDILTVFAGDKLADLNIRNTATISDNTYFILGANKTSGNLLDYSYDSGTAGFDEGTPVKDISHRSDIVWKVQKTGTIDVKFKVAYLNSSHLLVSGSPNFEQGLTRIYALDRNGITENPITVNSGEYITFAVSAGYTPGATGATVELWMAADKLMETLPGDSENITRWRDLSINKRDHVQNSGNEVPTFNRTENLMNFQPSLMFGATTNTKLIGPAHFIQSNRSYHVFYVSKTSETSTTRRVVYAFNASRNNNSGWVNGNPFQNTGNTTNGIHQGNGKHYGINAVLRPNDTSNPVRIYMNGVANSTTLEARSMPVTTGQSIIGNADTGTGYPFINGEIQEIIVLSKPQGSYLDAAAGGELDRINTYLALKYGITLNAGNYYNSAGTSVWDRNTNSGYTQNIFGIARDDKNGLYQAQAQSYDDPTFTIFKGNLADLNVNNHAELDDMSYLTLGSNGQSGTSTIFPYELGDTFQDGTKLENSATHRSSTVLKAETTGSFEVNMTVSYLNASNVLVSTGTDFSHTNTRVYAIGTDGVAHNVKINSGEYVSFTVNNIKPGGTGYDMELWLKADQIQYSIPSNGASVRSWMDVSGNNRHAIQATAANQPKFNEGSRLMSYQPSINFSAAAHRLQTQNPILIDNTNNRRSYYIFYVSEYTGGTSTTPATVFGLTNTNLQAWRSNTPFLSKNSATSATTSILFNQKAGTRKKYGIAGAIRPNNGTTVDRLFFNGVSQFGPNNALITGSSATNNGYIGSSSGTSNPFTGNIQEIVVLSTSSQGDIDPIEAQKINTYFALKYGISLDQGDYINGRGEIIWKRDDQGKYVNKIFGLGRDDRSGLYQKQASPYDESVFSVYLDEFASLNIYNNGKLEEREFVIFAARNYNNFWTGKGFAPGTAFANTTLAADEEINLVNNIFKANFVNVTGSKKTLGFKSDINKAKFLLISKDENFPEGERTRMFRFDANGRVDGVEIEDGEYVTLATLGYGPAGVIDGIRLWLKADDKSSLDLSPSIPDPNVASYQPGKTRIHYDWDVVEWKDQTEFNNNYRSDIIGFTSGTHRSKSPIKPKYLECSEEVNYQPALRFPTEMAGLGILSGPFSVNNPDHATIFLVYRLTDSDNGYTADRTRQYTMGFGQPRMLNGALTVIQDAADSRYPAMGFSPRYSGTRIRNQSTGTTDVEGSRGYKTEATALHMMHIVKASSSDGAGPKLEAEFSAYPDIITSNPTGRWGDEFRLASGATIGGASYPTGQFTGVMAEVIIFERELTPIEKERIDTYLALKYAMTLSTDPVNNTGNYDYVLSDGTVVWFGETEPYKNFHNNVAGLFRDDQSEAFVNKSKSTADGGIIMMRVPGIQSCGQGEQSGLINDHSGLFWGNNGLTSTTIFTNPADVCGLQRKSDRMWLVNKTNLTEQEAYIGIDGKRVSVYPDVGSAFEVYILVADSKEKLDNDEWDFAIPTVFNKETQMHEARYIFRNEHTYFRLASRAMPTACATCEFDEGKTLEFVPRTTRNPAGTWPDRFADYTSDREAVNDLGDGFSVKVKVGFQNPTSRNQFSGRNYPRAYRARVYNVDPKTGRRTTPAVTYNTLLERRRRDLYTKMITEIIPHTTGDTTNYIAAAASFRIFDIDHQNNAMDDIQIYGICDSGEDGPQRIAPTRVVRSGGVMRTIRGQRKDEDRYAFEMRTNSDFRAKVNTTVARAAYTDPRGHLDVFFDYPVSRIIIEHTDEAYMNRNIRNTTQEIGIGPITFTCPQPLPPVNEDGISFQKAANRYKDIPTCETVEYTFKILNATNYAAKVAFTDRLDEGMKWSLGTLKLDSINMANATITISEDGRTLSIDSLLIAGCNSIYQFSAGAYFDETETTAKSYTNQAEMGYRILVLAGSDPNDPDARDVFGSMLSCDAYSAEGSCLPTTIQTKDTDRPKFVKVSHAANCFKPGQEVTVKITVNNENGDYNDLISFDVNHNEEFLYKTGSFKASAGVGYSGTDPLFETWTPDPSDPEDTGKTPGYFYLENVSLPNGISTIEFTLITPERNDLIYVTDEDGNYLDKDGNITTNPNQYVPVPLDITYSFDGDVIGECSSSAFNESGGIIEVNMCTGKEYIITNRHITLPINKK